MNDLSKLSGLAGSHVRLILRGTVGSPRADIAEKLARTLGVSLDWLISGTGHAPSAKKVRAAVEAARAAADAAHATPTKKAS